MSKPHEPSAFERGRWTSREAHKTIVAGFGGECAECGENDTGLLGVSNVSDRVFQRLGYEPNPRGLTNKVLLCDRCHEAATETERPEEGAS